MSTTLLTNFSHRLGIRDGETLQKAMEILRRINAIRSTISKSDTEKVIICIDCAATSCNVQFDREEAIKLSGLSRKEYVKQKEWYEKRLDLGKTLSLDEICAQFEIKDVVKADAIRLITEYKKRKTFLNDVNVEVTLIMSIYQSYKLRNAKSNSIKTKLMNLSKLNKKMWTFIEEEWDKWIAEHAPLANQVKNSNTESQLSQVNKNGDSETIAQKNIDKLEVQPYEEWRESMLKKAAEMESLHKR